MISIETATLLLIALANVFTAWLTYRTRVDVLRAAENIQLVEKATNSMKDALVLATGKAERAAGVVEGEAAARAKP